MMTTNRRFTKVGQAIAYYRFRNPVRLKPLNIIEPDQHGFDAPEDEDPAGTWASIALAIRKVVNDDPEPLAISIFALKFLGERDQQYYKTEIAKLLNLRERHVARVIGRLIDALDDELVRRELKDPTPRGNYD